MQHPAVLVNPLAGEHPPQMQILDVLMVPA
jgi:hypothetical protein